MQMRFEGLVSLARNAAYLSLGHTASVVIRLIYLLVLVRWLSPTDYGKLSYGMAWYLTLIVLTYLGQEIVLSRDIGRGVQDPRALLKRTFLHRVIAIGVVFVLSITLATISERDADVLKILIVLTVAMVGRSLWMWSTWCFVAAEKSKYAAAIELMFRPLELLCAVAFISFSEPSILGIAVIHAASWCAQGFWGVARTRTVISRQTGIDVNDSRSILRDGVAGMVYALGLAWFLQAPVLLFRYFGDPGPVLGYFALAFQLIGHLQVIPYFLGAAALPILSRAAVRKDGKDRLLALAILAAAPAAGAIFVALAATVGRPIIALLFGEGYVFTANVLVAALWLLVPLSIAILLQQFIFAATTRTLLGSAAPLPGIIVMTLLYGPMTSSQGYKGAIFATGAGMAVWAVLTLYSLSRMGFFKRSSIA